MFLRSFFVPTWRSPGIKNNGAVRVLFSDQCNTKPGVIGTIMDSIKLAGWGFSGSIYLISTTRPLPILPLAGDEVFMVRNTVNTGQS